MSDFVERAAWLDQVQVGQRFRYTTDRTPPWTVTARRVEEVDGKSLICLLGIADDGSPRTGTGYGWVPVVIYEPVEVQQ